jgi:hypothetical protein
MANGTALLATIALLLALVAVLMAVQAVQLHKLKREAADVRALVAKMDWGAMLFNNVQQLRSAVEALDHIEKRLQKLEAIEKVHLSSLSNRGG